MALCTEVFAFLVTKMAVHAIKLILIVRRCVRIFRFYIFSHIDQCIGRMTLYARINAGHFRFFGIGSMALLTLYADLTVTICKKIIGACRQRPKGPDAGEKRYEKFCSHGILLGGFVL